MHPAIRPAARLAAHSSAAPAGVCIVLLLLCGGRGMSSSSGSTTNSNPMLAGGGIRVDAANNLYVVNAVAPTTSTAQTVLGFPPSASGNVAPALTFTSASWSSGGSEIAIH